MTGYSLTKKETEWVDMIAKKAGADLGRRKIKFDYDNVYTTAILAVTLFTRKLKLAEGKAK